MSIFEDVGYDDLLNGNSENDKDQLPDEDDTDQLFGNNEQTDSENQPNVPNKIQPKKRNVVNLRPRLNVDVLRGQRGLHTIEDYFKDVKFKGKGKEKEDLDEIMRRLQHWGHRMYPTLKIDDVLTNVERLGKKKPLQVHMSRYRLGMLESMKNHEEINNKDDVDQPVPVSDEPYDEFDALLDEQIAISKIVPRTPATNNSKSSGVENAPYRNNTLSSSNLATPFSKGKEYMPKSSSAQYNITDTSDLATPLPPSQPSTPVLKQQLSAEQIARVAENRRLAQERLAAKKRLIQEGIKDL